MEPSRKEKFAFPGLMERLTPVPPIPGTTNASSPETSETPKRVRKGPKPGPAAGAPPQPATGTNKTGKPRKIL